MKKIESLTPEQIARFPEFVKRWTDIGLSTAPADRPRAERAIVEMYRVVGLSAPKIVWCGSPLSQGLTRAIILDKKFIKDIGTNVRASVGASVRASVGDSVWDSVRDSVRAGVGAGVRASVWASVWDSVGDSVRASIGASVWASVWDSVGASVRASVWDSVYDSVYDSVGASVRASVRDSVRASAGDSVRASVGDSVYDSVYASVRASVRDSVYDSVYDSVRASVKDSVRASAGDSVRDSVWASVYGQHDANWLAFYSYFREVRGLSEQTEKLSGLSELSQSAGWALPHKNICWVSERHNLLVRDDAGRLHSVVGPACAYPDGWAIYAVHGTRIPSEWIENKTSLTPTIALKWTNIEQRRAACEILGWERILGELNAVSIDKDDDEMIGELVEVTLPDIGREKFLRVKCGTGRRFALAVPPHMKTALEANAWSYGVDTQVIKALEVRT